MRAARTRLRHRQVAKDTGNRQLPRSKAGAPPLDSTRYMEAHSSTMSAKRRSMAFPPGMSVVRATPRKGRQRVSRPLSPFALPRAAPAAKTWGSLSPPSPPPVRRHDAPCEAGTRRTGAARRFTAEDLGNPCQSTSNAGFWAQPGPRQRGLCPLRVQRCGGPRRVPPSAPPRCATPCL